MEPADAILHFWFGESADDAAVIRAKSALWWKKEPETDRTITERFGAILEAELRDGISDWNRHARGWLARIILLDQFSRNIHRNSPRAFEGDERARTIARDAMQAARDRELRAIERVFAYIPFEHSEDPADQAESVRLYGMLADEVNESLKPAFRNFLDYAEKHQAIIARFGRFPHRNAALGRPSTQEEIEFLRQPGSSF